MTTPDPTTPPENISARWAYDPTTHSFSPVPTPEPEPTPIADAAPVAPFDADAEVDAAIEKIAELRALTPRATLALTRYVDRLKAL